MGNAEPRPQDIERGPLSPAELQCDQPPKTRTCGYCVHAGWLTNRWPGQLLCVNHADSPGKIREVVPPGTCRNFRFRWEPTIRLPEPRHPNSKIRYIALTKGKFATVDAKDYDRLAKHKWTAYYTCGKWYAGRNDHGKFILMHREIMRARKGKVVDHIDGNGLNNCKSNLRICTYSQNNIYRRPRGVSSRYKCVYYDAKRNLWRSTPAYKGWTIFNGRYEREEDAARASDYLNIQLHGQYAYLNFPNEWPPDKRDALYNSPQAVQARAEARKRSRKLMRAKRKPGHTRRKAGR
jgi:hypothetical protein